MHRQLCCSSSLGCRGMPCAAQYDGAAQTTKLVAPICLRTRSPAVLPAQHQDHIDATRLLLGRAHEVTDVQLDLRIECVEARQRRRQALLRDHRLHAHHDGAADARIGGAGLFVGLGQLGQRWPAGLEIGRAAGGERQAVRVAFEQRRARARAPATADQLGHRRGADAEAARRRRETRRLGRRDEVMQRTQTVHSECLGPRDSTFG